MKTNLLDYMKKFLSDYIIIFFSSNARVTELYERKNCYKITLLVMWRYEIFLLVILYLWHVSFDKHTYTLFFLYKKVYD